MSNTKPISLQLISLENGRYSVCKEAMDQLEKIDEDIAVVGVAGLYRSGKSFLLNQLIHHIQKIESSIGSTTRRGDSDSMSFAFQVGPSVQPCTKGIWICSESIQVVNEQHSKPFRLIFMDTEGMGSFKASETHDAQIFALALLLSSFFIYNSSQTIDDNAINRLGLVTQLSQYIQGSKPLNNSSNPRSPSKQAFSGLSSQLPFFLWVVRDFSLQLHGLQGENITPTEYLELALSGTNENDNSSNMAKKDSVKSMIKEYFIDRDCFTLVRPVMEETKLQQLSTLGKFDIRPEFTRAMSQLANYLLKNIQPKTLHNQILNGRQFVLLCEQYCESLNKGSIVIDSCWENVVRSEAERLVSESRSIYQREIKQFIIQGNILTLEEFQQLHQEAEKKALKHFMNKLPSSFKNDKSYYQSDLKNQLEYDYQYYREKLKKASNHYCIKLINEHLNQLDVKLKSKFYNNDTTMERFQDDIKTMIQDYQSNSSGSEKDIVLLDALISWLIPSIRSLHQIQMNALTEEFQDEQKQIVTEHITNLDQLKHHYQLEQDSLLKKVNELKEHNEEQNFKYQELQHELLLKQQLFDENLSTIKILQSDISTRKQENQSLHEKVEALNNELDESLKQVSELKKQIRESKEHDQEFKEEIYGLKMSNQTLKIENESHQQTIQFLEQKNEQYSLQISDLTKDVNIMKMSLEEKEIALKDSNQLLERTKALLKSNDQEKESISKTRKVLEEKLLEQRNQIQDLENKVRQHELVIMNKNSHIRSFEREMEYEREKALESEDRLRLTMKERERLLAHDRTILLEKQVEQLNATNRRILEINKNVMEENQILRDTLTKHGATFHGALGVWNDLQDPLSKTKAISSLSSNHDAPKNTLIQRSGTMNLEEESKNVKSKVKSTSNSTQKKRSDKRSKSPSNLSNGISNPIVNGIASNLDQLVSMHTSLPPRYNPRT